MKDLISERLILLATAQESMMEMTDRMDQWGNSQLSLEKSAFDCLNISDKVLNLSKEGNLLVKKLQECCLAMMNNPNENTYKQNMKDVLAELHGVFSNITETSAYVNEISHQIEGEVAVQKEMEVVIKNTFNHVSESIDSALACAELMLAEFSM